MAPCELPEAASVSAPRLEPAAPTALFSEPRDLALQWLLPSNASERVVVCARATLWTLRAWLSDVLDVSADRIALSVKYPPRELSVDSNGRTLQELDLNRSTLVVRVQEARSEPSTERR